MRARLRPTRSSTSRGFTLAEMVVAVGAVALLTIGIGQIFSSVGSLVGTGAALAESDQLARALEAQLREDFAALNRMRAEDTFLLIRNRTLRSVYLSSEDRDFDRRAGVAPGDDLSRAFRTRLDEITFLAFGPGNSGLYKSAQVSDLRPGYTTPSAPTAMIYYGHGLRPEPPRSFDPDNPGADANVPERFWVPDGDFGQATGQPSRFDSSRRVVGRNEFASSWPLLRQSVVLVGPSIVGPKIANVGTGFDPNLTFAPYIRTREVATRRSNIWNGVTNENPDAWPGVNGGLYGNRPKPRFLAFGRTDICAQSPEEVRRWIEGYPDDPPGTPPPPPLFDATPFDAGLFDDRNVILNPTELGIVDEAFDSILWTRQSLLPTASQAQKDALDEQNLIRYQSALAGILTRRQAESDPPIIDRRDSLTVGSGTGTGVDPAGDDPSAALMDLHATLATRCSSFAVSWSDGTTWPLDEPDFELDVDDDGVVDIVYQPGDIVWFDIDFAKHDRNDSDDFADVIKTTTIPPPTLHNPEINPEEIDGERLRVSNQSGSYFLAVTGDFPETLYTGSFARIRQLGDEYLGIWGYRELAEGGSGEFSDTAWEKPKLIRIRATFHDEQLRLDEGRTYEFIFAINLAQ